MNKWMIALMAMAVLPTVTGLVLTKIYRNSMSRFSDAMNLTLDSMIRGEGEAVLIPHNDKLPESAFHCFEQETILGKLQAKLRRLYEIQRYYAKNNQEEKRKIQSLVSDISHQVKTPVANIKMYQDILQNREMEREKQKEFLTSMGEQIEKLDFLMKAMIEMSRLEIGIIEIRPFCQGIYQTLAQALGTAAPEAEKKGMKVTVECREDLLVNHDRKWTAEALYNLLDNGIKYTERGGNIGIQVSRWEFYTRITIKNKGREIPEESYGKIFERFYREPQVHNQEGIGIGLYLAREIITRQGGYIEVASKKGEGNIFSVFLPNE